MIVRLVELKKDEQKVQLYQPIEELLKSMIEDKQTCHALLGLGDTILRNIIHFFYSLKKSQISYEYQRFSVFSETTNAPTSQGVLNFKENSKRSAKMNNYLLLSPRGTLNSLVGALKEAYDSFLIGDPSKLCHTFLKATVSNNKKILIFMLIGANPEVLPLAHNILLQYEFDQAKWAFKQHPHKKPTTYFSSCIANELYNEQANRILMSKVHEYASYSDWLTTATKTEKTFRHTDSDLLSPYAVEVHRSLLYIKRKEVYRLQKEVEAEEEKLKHIWEQDVSYLYTHFLEYNHSQIIKVIDRRHCLEECYQMAQRIYALQEEIYQNEAAKKKLYYQLKAVHRDLKTSRLYTANQFMQIAYAFRQYNTIKRISNVKTPVSNKKPSRYSSVLTLIPLQVSSKKNYKSKLDKSFRIKDIEVENSKRLKNIEYEHQEQMRQLQTEHEYRQKTLVRRVHDATHNLRSLIYKAIMENSSYEYKQEISLLKSQIDSKRSRVL